MPLVLNGTTGVSGVDGSAGTPALQGSTSATGVFFSTGDVSVVTNGTQRVRVDYNTLSVQGATSDYAILEARSNGGAGNGYGAYLSLTNTSGAQFQIRVADSGSGTTYQVAPNFLTISAPSATGIRFSTNGIEAAKIDTNGYLLLPYQPCFSATATGTTQGAGTLQFNSAQTNVGNCFNTSTYRFTAPVAGNYFFCLSSIGTVAATTSISLYKNGTRFSGIGWGGITASAESGASINAVIPLAVGDYVTAYNNSSSYNASYNNFSGFLIG